MGIDWIANGQEWQSGEECCPLDHCNLTNMQVWLNHSRYPSLDMATDFAKEQFAGVYTSFYDFASRYYRIDDLLAGSAASPIAFKSLYPIYVFDVLKQSERLTEGVVLQEWNLVQMYLQIHGPMSSLSVIECSNLKAMEQS